MILPSDTPASPTKSNPPSTQNEAPPSYHYTGYSAVPSGSSNARPMPPPNATQLTPILIKRPSEERRAKGRACRRFTKALVVAVLVYGLAAMLFGSLTWGRNIKNGDWQYWGDGDPEWPEYTGRSGGWNIVNEGCVSSWDMQQNYETTGTIKLPDMEIEIPDSPDITIGDGQTNAPFHQRTSLTLSPDAVKHLIVGNRAYGNIQFTTASDNRLDGIKVDVTAYYWRQSVFERASVCKLQTKEGGEGVGIYMPKYSPPLSTENQIHFKVEVTFPVNSSKTPLIINDFETYLSIFPHHLHELREKVFFNSLKLRSSNALLMVDDVRASDVDLKTSNGQITGRYRVNKTLVLDTSNGRINVELELDDEGKDNDGVSVVMKSSNGGITANANLYSKSSGSISSWPFGSDKGGLFSIDSKTSNGALNLKLLTIPYESTLSLVGKTSNAPVDVQLDRKGSFEGTFKADTSGYMGAPIVERADRGGDRNRHLETNFGGKGHIAGKVYLDKWDDKKTGEVEMKTSNARISMKL